MSNCNFYGALAYISDIGIHSTLDMQSDGIVKGYFYNESAMKRQSHSLNVYLDRNHEDYGMGDNDSVCSFDKMAEYVRGKSCSKETFYNGYRVCKPTNCEGLYT